MNCNTVMLQLQSCSGTFHTSHLTLRNPTASDSSKLQQKTKNDIYLNSEFDCTSLFRIQATENCDNNQEVSNIKILQERRDDSLTMSSVKALWIVT